MPMTARQTADRVLAEIACELPDDTEADHETTVEYVRDAADAGLRKAIILLGHCVSEEAGMRYLASWLGELLPDVPVEFLPAGDPFWSV